MQPTIAAGRVSKEQKAAFRRIWAAPGGFIGWFRVVNNIPIGHR